VEIRNDKFKNTSNHQGRSGSATLNMEKLSLFMDSMISNYNKPELAVFREWVSNAHDAHVAAGIKRPVKVTLPSQLSPTLVVQDFGLGMTTEFVEKFYLSFGSSSKDKANDEIGGFGQGGKSALAIASQYTMTTVAGGLKNIYIFERSPMGGVDFKLVIEDMPTEEPSGTTVQVAVDRISEYSESNINRVLAGWSNDDIELSTGKKFFSIPDSGTLVSFEMDLTDQSKAGEEDFEEDIRAEKGYVLHGAFDTSGNAPKLTKELDLGRGEYVVLVGPVAYIFEPQLSTRRVLQDYMAASVNIGDVSFPSSREVIEPSRNNRNFVGDSFERIVLEADELLHERAKSVPDRKTALTLYGSPLAKNNRDLKISYKKEVVPTSFTPRASDSVFDYEHTGGWRGVKDYRLAERKFGPDTELGLTIQTLVIQDDEATSQSIRNNVRLRHTSLGDEPKDLSGYLVISTKPGAWLKAAAKTVLKSSELAEVARAYRKKKRDEAAAAAAAGMAPVVAVKKSRKDRIGEYSSNWLEFGKDAEGNFKVELVHSDLMEFFENHFDPKKTLVLSTSDSTYYPSNFVSHFQSFNVNPQDAQFLSVATGSKIETLRVLLGTEVEIVDLNGWMVENFANHASYSGRSPKEIAASLPFDADSAVTDLIKAVGLKNIHSKYAEIIEDGEELSKIQSLTGSYYDSNSRYIRNLLPDFSKGTSITERPEFFFLTKLGYYRAPELKKSELNAVAHSLNQMMENWLDNLALEEAEAEEAAAALAAEPKEEAAEEESEQALTSSN